MLLSSSRIAPAAPAAGPELLERRVLMAAVGGLWVEEFALPAGGVELRVAGTDGDDAVTVAAVEGGLEIQDGVTGESAEFLGTYRSVRVDGGAGNDRVELLESVITPGVLFGGVGDDQLVGGAGPDRLYGGDGADVLAGGGGDDVIVALGGGTADVSTGGAGRDSFWLDATRRADPVGDLSLEELVTGSLHRVASFYTPPGAPVTARVAARTITLGGADLADPAVSDAAFTYKNFADYPLYSDAGPRGDDVTQGMIGDCYFVVVLLSVADLNPTRIRESVVDLGDGTYAVQFGKGRARKTVHVDADLPVMADGQTPAYADLGVGGAMWSAIMEKAFAAYRRGGALGYAGLDLGWMRETHAALGVASRSIRANTSFALLKYISSELALGKSVTYATLTAAADAPIVEGHAYAVLGVETDASGNLTGLRLRNPWGVDGAGNDGADDGYVSLTAHQALVCHMGVVSAVA